MAETPFDIDLELISGRRSLPQSHPQSQSQCSSPMYMNYTPLMLQPPGNFIQQIPPTSSYAWPMSQDVQPFDELTLAAIATPDWVIQNWFGNAYNVQSPNSASDSNIGFALPLTFGARLDTLPNYHSYNDMSLPMSRRNSFYHVESDVPLHSAPPQSSLIYHPPSEVSLANHTPNDSDSRQPRLTAHNDCNISVYQPSGQRSLVQEIRTTGNGNETRRKRAAFKPKELQETNTIRKLGACVLCNRQRIRVSKPSAS